MLDDDFYSKMVTIFKILLPSIALLILSFLFLLPDSRTKLRAINEIDKSILRVVNKAGINKPSFRGTLASGSNLELYAREILQKNKDKSIIEINEITARLEIDKKNLLKHKFGKQKLYFQKIDFPFVQKKQNAS